MLLFNKLFHFVMTQSIKFNIDESHGLPHSMNVLLNAKKIYDVEVVNFPQLVEQERIIFVSAVLHDMCDKKYMNEKEGIKEIQEFLRDPTVVITEKGHTESYGTLTQDEIDSVCSIITTMSYSKVKRVGYPDLGELQRAYHIVREADLLAAYDFDRCMIYNMKTSGDDLTTSYENACTLFSHRVLQHIADDLFFTDVGRKEAFVLHQVATQRICEWKTLLNK